MKYSKLMLKNVEKSFYVSSDLIMLQCTKPQVSSNAIMGRWEGIGIIRCI